ncbi:MAG: 4'-phosphopantetheinyl transferase superfamily protein [Chloroflexota bacterium]|nr:4'-phosphopantetheinyl transferase superfamily protein [Chloroflexota bacterium]
MKTVSSNSVCKDSTSRLHWWSPFLVFGKITVAKVDLSANAAREKVAAGWLEESERSRIKGYLPEPRRHFVLCRAALRAILCQELGCHNGDLSFGEGEYGKPFALVAGQAASVSFSVSHSGRYGLIALARSGRLGVDLEQAVAKRHLNTLIEAVMGPDERRELGEMMEEDKLRQFFRLWTCKEALVKAFGTGFSTDVSSFQVPESVRQGGASGVFRFPHLPDLTWRLEAFEAAGFAAALAWELPPTDSDPTDSAD